MSFADRLKEYRRDRGFSQEDLADQLGVSRQAIGKWEQGQAYPEVEKLLALCGALHVSMDALMAEELPEGCCASAPAPAESILILSENEINLVRCVSVMCSKPYKSRRLEPKYALFGITGYTPFWGQHNVLLGWYADLESIQKEIKAIQQAMRSGSSEYTLQHAVKVRRRWGRIEIIES